MNIKSIKQSPKFPVITERENGDTIAYYFEDIQGMSAFQMPNQLILCKETSTGVKTYSRYTLTEEVMQPNSINDN
jgi:hypothetical protein